MRNVLLHVPSTITLAYPVLVGLLLAQRSPNQQKKSKSQKERKRQLSLRVRVWLRVNMKKISYTVTKYNVLLFFFFLKCKTT